MQSTVLGNAERPPSTQLPLRTKNKGMGNKENGI